MSHSIAIIIHLLLLVDKAYTKKGELVFFILIEFSFSIIGVFYFVGTVYR